jgi:hypothetical protein
MLLLHCHDIIIQAVVQEIPLAGHCKVVLIEIFK